MRTNQNANAQLEVVALNPEQIASVDKKENRVEQCVNIVKKMVFELETGNNVNVEKISGEIVEVWFEWAEELVEFQDEISELIEDKPEFYTEIFNACDLAFATFNLNFRV